MRTSSKLSACLLSVCAGLLTLQGLPRGMLLAAETGAQQQGVDTAPPKDAGDIAATYLDPGKFMMPELLRIVPQRYANISLVELTHLLKSQFQIDCVLDVPSLEAEGLTGQETVTLPDQMPLYLALERVLEVVAGIPLDSYTDDGVLVLTTQQEAQGHLVSESFNVQPLLDAGFKGSGSRGNLPTMIQSATDGPWLDVDGEGGQMSLVGNVLVVRQSERQLREVARLLQVLEHPTRLTYVSDPPQNEMIREALKHPCSVDFDGKPLDVAISEIGAQLQVPVDLDVPELEEEGLTGTEQVSLVLENKPGGTVLQFLLRDVGGTALTAIPEWGVLRVTTQTAADEKMATVVLEVRDLLAQVSATGLIAMIQEETSGPWFNADAEGGQIESTPNGCLIIRQTEKIHQEVIQLLRRLRQLLALGKPAVKQNPNAIETRFYRLPEKAAMDLFSVIPQQVASETWESMGNHSAVGTISIVSIGLQPRPSQGGFLQMGGGGMGGSPPQEKPGAAKKMEEQATLIIRQTVAVHQQIGRFVNELLYDNPEGPPTPPPGICRGLLGGISGGTGDGMGEE